GTSSGARRLYAHCPTDERVAGPISAAIDLRVGYLVLPASPLDLYQRIGKPAFGTMEHDGSPLQSFIVRQRRHPIPDDAVDALCAIGRCPTPPALGSFA